MKLSEIMFPADLQAEIDNGYVTERFHPVYDYRVLNYSPKTQYEQRWNNVTEQCRGLILDKNNLVIFRPPRKFYNYGQTGAPEVPLYAQVDVLDKLDGSFLAIFPTPDGYECATRGSFTSQQAIDATAFLKEKYSHVDFQLSHSVYAEWIGPANRIVLDYPENHIVLLGAVANYTGELLLPREARQLVGWTGLIAQDFIFDNFYEVLEYEFPAETEGFVIKYNNMLVKVKSEDYLRLHRLIFNLNDKRIWEQLKDGMTKQEIIKDLPDEFQKEVGRKVETLLIQSLELQNEISDEYLSVRHIEDRKEYALAVKDFKHRPAMFVLKDGKSINEYLWRKIEPHGDNSL